MIAMTGFSMMVVWQGGKNVLWFRSGGFLISSGGYEYGKED